MVQIKMRLLLYIFPTVYYAHSFVAAASWPSGWLSNAFPLIKGMHMLPGFADLRALTAVSGCGKDLLLIAQNIIDGCDPYGRTGGLGYPPFIFQLFRGIGIKVSHTNLLAFVIGLGFFFVVLSLIVSLRVNFYRVHRYSYISDIFIILILLSTPFQLALERMNIDILIFIFVALFSCSLDYLSICHPKMPMLSNCLIVLSGLIGFCLSAAKIYPALGIIVYFLWRRLCLRRLAYYEILILVMTCVGLFSTFSWILIDNSAARPSTSFISYGLPIIIGGNRGASVLASFSSLIFLGYGYRIAKKWIKTNTSSILELKQATHSSIINIVSISTLTAALCYLTGTSFAYRFIFLLPYSIFVFSMRDLSSCRKWSLEYLNPLLVVSFFVFPTFLHVQGQYLTLPGFQENIDSFSSILMIGFNATFVSMMFGLALALGLELARGIEPFENVTATERLFNSSS